MSEFLSVPPVRRREPLLMLLLLATGGYGGNQLHDSDMQHMRERVADIRNADRDRYEELMLHCNTKSPENR